jgi:hypothetical protein
MAKKPKVAPKPEHIEAASKTSSIKQLVWLADAFHRVGARGALQTQIPLFCACEVAGKGYRRFNLPIDTWLECESMRVGAREGLIFRFRPKNTLERSVSTGGKEKIEAVEMSWLDVCNLFTDLADQIEGRIKDVRNETVSIDDLNKEIRSMIAKNAQMHPIITEGFKKAQETARNHANDDVMEHIDGYGMF